MTGGNTQRLRHLLLVLVFCATANLCAALDASGEAPRLRTENRALELVRVFHPAQLVGPLREQLAPLDLFAQSVAAALLIGALMLKLRRDEAQMEHIAGMLLKVAFIATVPFWKVWAFESGELVSGLLATPAVSGPGIGLEQTAQAPNAGLSPVLTRLWALGEQWELRGSPLSDALDGTWVPGEGRDEEQLAKGWNWAKPPLTMAGTEAEALWAAETNARRAGALSTLIGSCGALVQATFVGHHVMEMLRLLVFHAGCAVAPFCIAGLGTRVLQLQSARALLALLGVAFWPLVWALGNAASSVLLDTGLGIARWACSSALFPKLPSGEVATLALSAPALSWWNLSALAVMTAAICLWMLGVLLAGPWCLHRLLAAGARWAGF